MCTQAATTRTYTRKRTVLLAYLPGGMSTIRQSKWPHSVADTSCVMTRLAIGPRITAGPKGEGDDERIGEGEGDGDISDEQYEGGQEDNGQCKKRRRRNGQSKKEDSNYES